MSLPVINLDDKSFNQLVEEAKKIIPQYNSEWSNYNRSDPGITLVELFAWLTEAMLYKMDQVPEKNILNFLKLLGVNKGELESDPDETIEEAVARAILQNSELIAVTDDDIKAIVLDILEEYNLHGKVYVIDNYDLSLCHVDSSVASITREGHVSVFVVPHFLIHQYKAASEKNKISKENYSNTELAKYLGGLDEYYEEKIIKDDLIVKEDTYAGDPYSDKSNEFGYAVSMYGNNILVGAPGTKVTIKEKDTVIKNAGVVYVYYLNDDGTFKRDENNAAVRFTLSGPNPKNNMRFGTSVCMGEYYAIIGSPELESSNPVGTAYIYGPDKKGGWSLRQTVKSKLKNTEGFGLSVAINNSFALVGAPYKEIKNIGTKVGTVYVYIRSVNSSWKQVQELQVPASEQVAEACFGTCVSMTDRYALVSAPNKTINGVVNAGAVYLFTLNMNDIWEYTAVFTAPEIEKDCNFGRSIHINGEFIIIGSNYKRWAVHIFRLDISVWKEVSTLHPTSCGTVSGPLEEVLIKFGLSVSIDNYTAVASAMIKRIPRGKEDKAGEPSDLIYKIYVYRGNVYDEWKEVAILKDKEVMRDFAKSIALDSNRLVAGAFDGTIYAETFPVMAGIGDFIPSTDLMQAVYNRLFEKRLITNRIHLRGPMFKKVKLTFKVKGVKGVKDEAIKANIKSSLFQFFDPVFGGQDSTGYPMGRSIYITEVIERIEEADGVDYLDLEKFHIFILNEVGNYERLEGSFKIEYYETIQLDMDAMEIDILE